MNLDCAQLRKTHACPSSASSSRTQDHTPARDMLMDVRNKAGRLGNTHPGNGGKQAWPLSSNSM
eukprot:7930636-Lingulodinium_polyedra.AAC.1